jgi:hypothetical protein
MIYPEISIFKYAEVSRYVADTISVKQSDSNFMTDTIHMGKGGYKKVIEKVHAPKEECTHISINGVSFDPKGNVAKHYKGRYYSHEYEFELSQYPELHQWVLSCNLWEQSPGCIGGDFHIRKQAIIQNGDTFPRPVIKILKGVAVKERLDYDNWYATVGTPQAYHDGMLPFILWAERLMVEAEILIVD